MDTLRNYMMAVEQGQKQAAADAERAMALQDDPSFWVPGEELNRFDCLPLWHCICAFKSMDHAHWALTSPTVAARWERHTTGQVAARLKELVQLHTRALGGIKMGLLKASGGEAKSFETNMVSLTEWTEKVSEVTTRARNQTNPAPSGNEPTLKSHTTKGNRRDTITPVIEHAQNLCKNKWDTAEVWVQLQTLTAQQYTVLLYLEDDAVVYTNGDNTKKLTRKNLGDRLRTAQKKLCIAV